MNRNYIRIHTFLFVFILISNFEVNVFASSPNDNNETTSQVLEKLEAQKAKLENIEVPKSSKIHSACLSKDIEVLKQAIASGEDVNAEMQDGTTPLHLAVYTKNIKSIELLLEKGANIKAVTHNGLTPLHTAINVAADSQIITTLINAGIEIDAGDHEGTTPLMIASRKRNSAAASLLIARGASTTVKNKAGLTAVDYAHKSPVLKRALQNDVAPENEKNDNIIMNLKESMESLKNKNSLEWTYQEVAFWLKLIGLPGKYSSTIPEISKKLKIDGKKLFSLTSDKLISQFEISSEIANSILNARSKINTLFTNEKVQQDKMKNLNKDIL